MGKENTSMRDDFEEAISAIESDDEGAITTETQADADENPITAEDILPDEEGKEAETKTEDEEAQGEISDGEQDTTTDTTTDDGGERATKGDGETDGDLNTAEDIDTPPVSWTPAAREGWKEIPENMRTQIAKREREIGLALEDGKDNRKAGERFNDIATRYAQVIAAEGVTDPLTGFEEMMKVMSVLRSGTPDQKAQKLAQFIQGYQVPLDKLDSMLAQSMGAAPTADDNVTRLLDERMQPVNALLEQIEQNKRRNTYQANQAAINEVVAFKQANEFYTDVQADMADMVEMAERRGVKMPLEDAYQKACAMNPEVSKIISDRAENVKLMGGEDELRKKREAASSIHGSQLGGQGKSDDLSLHDELSQAWDEQSG